jgi:7,8-dihydropterin-6-yl-methyl-4-(beta-D-ribofuranosyl)aminobenzene 5'-phosphate synthase
MPCGSLPNCRYMVNNENGVTSPAMTKPREVEHVEVACLVDNTMDSMLSDSEIAKRDPVRSDWDSRPLFAEHGFSAVLSLEVSGGTRRLLFDAGLDPLAAPNNAAAMNLDLTSCDAVALSHGHVDHFGGLLTIKQSIGRGRIPLVLHPYALRTRYSKLRSGEFLTAPAPDKTKLSEAGYNVVEKRESSLWVNDSVLVTGQIPRRNDFETGVPDHYSEIDGRIQLDPLVEDDQAVVVNVKDKGLVVITGCGHSGLINTLNYAKELTGEDRIYAAMGGMHLGGRLSEPRIPRTMEELKKLNPHLVIPCHCSGLRAMSEMMNQMPSSFIQNSVGTRYTF